MLDYSITNDPGAIEREICEKMEALPIEGMSNRLFNLLVYLHLINEDFNISKKDKQFLQLIIEKKLETTLTLKINDTRLILLLCELSKTPGIAMLYLWYLQYWAFKNKMQELDLIIFCQDIFNNGFFKQSDLDKIWDHQKLSLPVVGDIRPDNLVDYHSSGLSIQF